LLGLLLRTPAPLLRAYTRWLDPQLPGQAGHAGARLEALCGPLQGRVFPLVETEISIGRDPSNQIAILESLVSRRHCVIRKEGSEFRVLDLDSRNCTFVNGIPAKERSLAHGDEIRVGSSIFVYHDPDSLTDGVRMSLSDTPGGNTVVLRKEDALYLRPASNTGALQATARTVHDLDVLLQFSMAVNSIREIEALGRRVLEAVGEAVPAERAALLLVDDGSEEFSRVVSWDRQLGFNRPVEASQNLLRQVIEEGTALLSNGVPAPASPVLSSPVLSSPVLSSQVRSIMATPLDAPDQRLGVLYLETGLSGSKFDNAHLQLVTALGNVAALALDNLRRLESLEDENRRLLKELNIEHNMVGESQAMREVYQFIARVAGTDSTVLIWGESGTGKELVARAIHANSGRAANPFVAINCASITETLLESELFGHEKGAFTGAVSQKKGKLEVGNGGTVFLDEIGELAAPLQAKLLRVLQEREFERLGGTRTIKLDIRVVAATNRDLKEASRTGAFRQDLYYRLNVVSVRMPSLRERRSDIPLLANYFAVRFSEKVKRQVSSISEKALACLLHYDWPGNVREMENAIERALVLGSTPTILPEDLPEAIVEESSGEGRSATALHEGLRRAKKEIIERAIEQTGGNFTEAAGILGVHPNHLFRLVRTLHLKPKRQR
jgi:transcriptional regulator with GAF, ATPase, and Fis domain